MAQIDPVPAEVMELLQRVTTGMVKDALAISGIKSGIAGIRPVRGFEDAKIVGPATTVLFSSPRPDAPKLNNYLVIEQSPAGSILVIDGKGYDGHFAGDNQGAMARRQGLRGIVVYGGARDLAGYREMGMPLYCTGSATRDKPADLQLAAYNVPVEIGGVLVKPGDVLIADEDGVVAIPREALGILMENMKIMFEVEDGMETAIQSGASAAELSAIIAKKKPTKK
ncbi:MAG: RraA family protein [Chloroflexi bacterium]|nr:RraA family protein [Chloroflexota bacterium]